MKTINALMMGFLAMVAATWLFAVSTAFANTGQVISQHEEETVAEVSGDQSSLETVAPHLPSGCIADSMVIGDGRRPDRRVAGSEGSRILTPVKADECTETGYTMPMNR